VWGWCSMYISVAHAATDRYDHPVCVCMYVYIHVCVCVCVCARARVCTHHVSKFIQQQKNNTEN